MKLLKGLMLATIMSWSPASAHDYWDNGMEVPPWVKSICCGKDDIHKIKPEAVHRLPDGIHVDGLTTVIPYEKVQPSPDGKYWGFWSTLITNPSVYCFFAPFDGS